MEARRADMTKMSADKKVQMSTKCIACSDIADFVPVPMLVTNTDGLIVHANEEVCTLTGFSGEKLCGRRFSELLRTEATATFVKLFNDVQHAGTTVRQEFSLKKEDGTFVPVALTMKKNSLEKPCVVCILDDLSREIIALSQLAEKEYQFRKTFESSPVGMAIVGMDMRLIDYNNAFAKFLGYDRETLKGKTIADITYPEDRELGMLEIKLISEGRLDEFEVEKRYVTSEGKIVWGRVSIFLVRDSEGAPAYFLPVIQNITSGRIAQELLKTSAEVVKSIPSGLFIYRYEAPDKLYFLEGNPAALQMTRLDPEKVAGLEFNEIWPEAKNVGITESYLNVMRTLQPFFGTDVYYADERISGAFKIIAFPIEGNKLGVAFEDITEQKKMEQGLKLSEEKFRSYVEHAPEGFLITDADGDFTDCNNLAATMLGFGLEDLPGRSIQQIVPGELSGEMQNCLKQLTHAGFFMGEFKLIRKDKSSFFALLSAVKLQPTQFLFFIRNIDEIKETQAELIRQKERAEESDKLKSAFLANMSHEIRTPMNGIMGFSEMMMNTELSVDKRMRYSRIVNDSGRQLMRIVEDILDYSKINSGKLYIAREAVEVYSLMQDLYSFFEPRMVTKKIKFTLLPGNCDSTCFFLSDRTRLTQVLTNLIDNAMKFTSKGEITIGHMREDNNLIFFVRDTGIGIPETMKESVFEPFRQVETGMARQYGGTGLGLSISKSLISLMQGKIWFRSEIGKGSEFFVSLPYKHIEKKFIPQDIQAFNEPQAIQLKILIAEDEEVNYFYVKEALSKSNIALLRARNGEEMIQLFSENRDACLIFMDLKMPVMNGFEATRIIRKLDSAIPIIALTAFAGAENRTEALEAGCNEFVEKPVDLTRLTGLIVKYTATNPQGNSNIPSP